MQFEILCSEEPLNEFMAKERDTFDTKPGIGFKIFSHYLRFFHNHIYYRKTHWIDTENIPEEGSLMIVSDHQNCLSDALALLMAIFHTREKRQHRILARADVFKPLLTKPLRWLGIMPAFRLDYDGAESLSNNTDTFNESEEELLKEGTLIMYPEAGHQDKRWLGFFSYGYTRLLFNAAERSNFEKELFILPSCNHYSNYFDIREEVLIKFGTPISIAPFYELYKTKPRTAQRQVNALVREQISGMMLNITDLENYDSIDFLRESAFGREYALKNGFNPDDLPDKLLADKQLVASLETAKAKQEENTIKIYQETRKLKQALQEFRISDLDFGTKIRLPMLLLQGLLLLMLCPFFLFACIPNIFIYLTPRILTRKLTDVMFYSSITFGFQILISIPIFYTLTFALTWIATKSWLIAILYLVTLPFLGIFAWNFYKASKQWLRKLRFYMLKEKGKLKELTDLRKHLYCMLNELLNQVKD